MTDHEKALEMIMAREAIPIALDPAHTALLIVDVQRFFTKPDADFARVFEKVSPGLMGGYFKRTASTVLPNIKRLQECFRSSDLPVIFCVFGGYRTDGQDLPTWLRDFDQLALHVLGRRVNPVVNGESWQVDDAISPLPGEMVFNKTSSGALASTKLDQLLNNAGITSLVVCGLTTAVCVAQTARETADRGFRVVIAEDACTEMSVEEHDAALLTFRRTFGQARKTSEITGFFADRRVTTKTVSVGASAA